MPKPVLVIFKNNFPEKENWWWRQFSTVIAPRQLKEMVQKSGLTFVSLDDLVDPGSVQEASELLRKISLLTTSDGRRISKIIKYEGFELWWIHYDNLMNRFCLSYTQYRRLLVNLKNFPKVELYEPPFEDLFRYFLDVYNCQYSILGKSPKKFLSLGILFQVAISAPFLLWVKIRGPKILVQISDQFDPPRDYDFRMRLIYEELLDRKINFVEFVRSMESSLTVLRHALKRRRPVVYFYAIVTMVSSLASLFNTKTKSEILSLRPGSGTKPEQKFLFLVATNYLHNATGDIWSIQAMKLILKFIGIKAAIIPSAGGRNLHEVLACKLLGIRIVGIQHGMSSKDYMVSDFMHEFDGEKCLSVDKYGLWSEWWREYYLKNSKAYKPEQLYVSGPMRPLEKQTNNQQPTTHNTGPIKVLFVSEKESTPQEALHYLLALLGAKDISVYLKSRPYRDRFEDWLKKNQPEIIDKMTVLRGNMHEAIDQCNVVVGSYSTGVLEALLGLKPLVCYKTKKWGDYFELKDYYKGHPFFAENPYELIDKIKNVRTVSVDVLKSLQERYFGDPYKNGSKWVVDTLIADEQKNKYEKS